MKYVVSSIMLAVALVFAFVFLPKSETTNQEYLRVHIRANSNEDVDQSVKYKIKDKVVDYLIPLLTPCATKTEAESIISNNLLAIDDVATKVLTENGFSYKAKSRLANELFPTREYDGLVLESGFYDALIVDLGSAKGDNWWCVVYPPFCFLKSNSQTGVVYKSKILEIIKKITG